MNIFIFSIIIFLMTSFSNALSNEQPARLALGLGIFNFMENGSVRCERPENGGCDATSGGASLASYEKSSIVYNLEYYFSNKVFNYIQPSVGFLGTTENAQYGYFGLSLDLFFGNCKCFLLTPGLAAGWYIDGDDIKMGSRIQFKSAAVRRGCAEGEAHHGGGALWLRRGQSLHGRCTPWSDRQLAAAGA